MMPILRAVAILIGLGVIGCAATWVVTRERRWLDRAILLVKVGIGVGVVFWGVGAVDRLLS